MLENVFEGTLLLRIVIIQIIISNTVNLLKILYKT